MVREKGRELGYLMSERECLLIEFWDASWGWRSWCVHLTLRDKRFFRFVMAMQVCKQPTARDEQFAAYMAHLDLF